LFGKVFESHHHSSMNLLSHELINPHKISQYHDDQDLSLYEWIWKTRRI